MKPICWAKTNNAEEQCPVKPNMTLNLIVGNVFGRKRVDEKKNVLKTIRVKQKVFG